jgi:hypothetical protein
MKKLQILLILIGVVQLVLGVLFLFAPQAIMSWMGLAVPASDNGYTLGMLAARFIALGIGMFWCARDPERNQFWIRTMILIQAIDLAAGIYYTIAGIVALASSAFPMFNAALFIILLTVWRPKSTFNMATAN